MRGNYEYKRLCGWRRFALNVLNKYDDNNWLGVDKRNDSSSSVRGEWPVSYHGTAKDNCKSIAEDGYLLVVFQNRVNPNTLIKISKEETGIGEYWISDGADLRPYGICIKKEFC
ncbi:hypothetical protein C1646_756777 [Rhizophagus diaphanus]|nr:hypothetical protein C1646_756777 [Rhizophagus diaphanus] [Rhizophagus sp. MUCL 43196]